MGKIGYMTNDNDGLWKGTHNLKSIGRTTKGTTGHRSGFLTFRNWKGFCVRVHGRCPFVELKTEKWLCESRCSSFFLSFFLSFLLSKKIKLFEANVRKNSYLNGDSLIELSCGWTVRSQWKIAQTNIGTHFGSIDLRKCSQPHEWECIEVCFVSVSLPHLTLTGYDLNASWCHELPHLSCDKFTLLPIQYVFEQEQEPSSGPFESNWGIIFEFR